MSKSTLCNYNTANIRWVLLKSHIYWRAFLKML